MEELLTHEEQRDAAVLSNPHRNTKKPRKHSTLDSKRSTRTSTPKSQIHNKPRQQSAKKQGTRTWPKTPDQKTDYQQWGYIRHQHSPEDLVAVRRQFNAWKRKLLLITEGQRSVHRPWQDQGKWLFGLNNMASMRKAWEELDLEARKQQWTHVMLSTLYTCPQKAGQVLGATLDPLPPGFAIADTMLYYLKAINLEDIKNPRDRASKAEEVVELVAKILVDLPAKHVPLRQYALALLAGKLPTDQVAEVYQIIRQAGLKLHWHTRLRFASALSKKFSYKETAYDMLRSLPADGIDLNQPVVASVITTLLHSRDTDTTSSNSFSPQRAMEFFLENGYAPNLASFTALVDSLCKQGELAEAIRLPLLLAENGADLDRRCYEIVFRGAKHSLKASNVRQALDVAKAAKAPYVDVLNNTLHSIFYFAEMECREKRHQESRALPLFTPMLGIYSKKFDLKPLQWLVPDVLPLILEQGGEKGREKFGPSPREEEWNFTHSIMPVAKEFFESGSGSRQEPTSATLAIMLRAYIKSLKNPYDIMSFYSFFKTRLEDSDAETNWAVEMVKEQGSIIHDTLILTMLEHRSLLRPALQVFGDMLRDSIKTKASEDSKDEPLKAGDSAVHPAPNLFTFNIVIHGLFLRREKMLAEQVLGVLREHKLKPNDVTWNTLVKGYASMQKLSQTVGTLQDLEAAGFKPDTYTFRAFARLNDQTRALQMMERIIYTNMKRLEEDQQW